MVFNLPIETVFVGKASNRSVVSKHKYSYSIGYLLARETVKAILAVLLSLFYNDFS